MNESLRKNQTDWQDQCKRLEKMLAKEKEEREHKVGELSVRKDSFSDTQIFRLIVQHIPLSHRSNFEI